MSDIFDTKESRADFRYTPLCKPIIDVMCLPTNKEEKVVFGEILDHYSKPDGSN